MEFVPALEYPPDGQGVRREARGFGTLGYAISAGALLYLVPDGLQALEEIRGERVPAPLSGGEAERLFTRFFVFARLGT